MKRTFRVISVVKKDGWAAATLRVVGGQEGADPMFVYELSVQWANEKEPVECGDLYTLELTKEK